MANLTVSHYLHIYSIRKKMQEQGITNPSEAIKKFTIDFVNKLKTYPLDEEILLVGNAFFDGQGRLLVKVPD